MDTRERFYYPGLDALRGIAIILVILFHYFLFFRVGWMGVDLFFVLSGFLITSILLRECNSKNYFKNFYTRRILRIFPLYYLVLIIFYVAAPLVFSQKDPSSTYGYYTENQTWFWLFFQNWLLIKKGPPPEPYLIHFWSLAIEEQFYIVWPFIVFFIKKKEHLKYVLGLLFFSALILRLVTWLGTSIPAGDNYYNSFARMDSLAAGAFLAVLAFQNQKIPRWLISISIIGFIILLAASWVMYKDFEAKNTLFATVGYSVCALFFMSVCFLALNEKSLIAKIYFLKPIGRISYGLYVFHLPVFLVLSSILNRIVFRFTDNILIIKFLIPVACMAATLLVSAASYKFFEVPFLRLKNKFR